MWKVALGSLLDVCPVDTVVKAIKGNLWAFLMWKLFYCLHNLIELWFNETKMIETINPQKLIGKNINIVFHFC